jgi:hypothetical protein
MTSHWAPALDDPEFTSYTSCTIHFLCILYNSFLIHPVQFTSYTSRTIHFWYTLYNSLLIHPVQFTSYTSCTIHFLYILYNSLLIHSVQFTSYTSCTIPSSLKTFFQYLRINAISNKLSRWVMCGFFFVTLYLSLTSITLGSKISLG